MAQIAALTNTKFTAEELAKLKATQNAEQAAEAIGNVVAGNIKRKQVGLENIEASELEAELEQQAADKPEGGTEQIGADGVKFQGKAVFKINQKIE